MNDTDTRTERRGRPPLEENGPTYEDRAPRYATHYLPARCIVLTEQGWTHVSPEVRARIDSKAGEVMT